MNILNNFQNQDVSLREYGHILYRYIHFFLQWQMEISERMDGILKSLLIESESFNSGREHTTTHDTKQGIKSSSFKCHQ